MNLEFFETHWAMTLGAHVGAVLILSALGFLATLRFEHRLVLKHFLSPEISLTRKFLPPFILLVVSVTVGFFPSSQPVPDEVAEILLGVAKVGTILGSMALALHLVSVAISIYSRGLRVDQPNNLRERRLKTQVQYLEKILDLVVVVVAFIAFMLSFEAFRRVGGSLLASAGLATAILGFSAQRSLGNLIAGFQIAFTQPIRLGDSVIVENEWGEIEEITLTYVVVKIWDLRRLILPITYFLEKPFQNWTRTSAELLGQVLLYVDYTMPIEPLRGELKRILKGSPRWDGRVGVVQVTDFSERTQTVRLLMSSYNSGMTFDLRCEVREGIIDFIQRNYPQGLPQVRMDYPPLIAKNMKTTEPPETTL